MSRLSVSVLIVAAAALTSGDAIPSSGESEVVSRSFQAVAGGTLRVDACFGSIDVEPGDQERVEVEIRRKPSTFNDSEAKQLFKKLIFRFEQRGQDIFVFVERDEQSSFFSRLQSRGLNLQITAKVPKRFNVDLKTSGGTINVADLKGRVEARTSGGSLYFGRIEGPVSGRTSGGSISLQSCSGDADIRTSGGSISIGHVKGNVEAHTSGGSLNIAEAEGSVNASTSGGSISVEDVKGAVNASTSGGTITAKISAQPLGDCRLATSGGGINVMLAPSIRFSVDAKTSGGRVTTQFPVTLQGEIEKRHLIADINGGGPLLFLRTSGGNIHIRKL